jgi:SAM-dependent methyltransferase
VDNESEHKRWNHPVWVATWPNREAVTGAVTPFLLQAIAARPGWRVCDVGCGAGPLTLALASAVGPQGEAVGFDISAGLLELARVRAADAGTTNVRFVERDMQSQDIDDGQFEVVASQFGVMFFDEPTRALRALRERLTPSGRLVFSCWQGVEKNPWHVGTVLRPLVPPPRTPGPGKSPVGPFAFGDEEYVRELLEAAGYATISAVPHEITARGASSAVTDPTLLPVMGVPPARQEEAMALIARHLERFAVGPDQFEFPLSFMIYEAAA